MDATLRQRLDEAEEAYRRTIEELADPRLLDDQDRYREVAIRHGELRSAHGGVRPLPRRRG